MGVIICLIIFKLIYSSEQIDNIDPLRVRNSSFTKDTDLAGNADNECSNEPNNDTSSVDACVDDDQVSEQSIIKKSQDGVCSSDDCTSLSPQYDQFEGCQIMEDISKCNRDYNIIVDTLIDCDFGQKNLRQWKNASKDVINEILLIKQSKGKLSKHDKKSLMDKYDLTDKKIKNIIKNHQSKRRLN